MNKNKTLKIIGGIVTVIALFFIVKKLVELKINYALLVQGGNLFYILLFSVLYGANVFVSSIPWKVFVGILTQKKVPFREASWVMSKSNLMKYIPGNVFQYVGRNELAIRLKLSHVDVSFATVCEILLIVLVNFVIAFVLYGQGVITWYTAYGISNFKFVFIVLGIIVIVAVILMIKYKERVIKYVKNLGSRIFADKHNIIKIVLCFLLSCALTLLTGFLFAMVLYNIVGVNIDIAFLPAVIGAYALSWVAGFLMPGAPGGIGVREAVITLLLSGIASSESVLLAAVIYRLITIVGDFVGLFLSFMFLKISERKIQISQ